MRALVIDRSAPGGIRFVTDYSDPQIPSGEVLIQVHLAGVCSTDLELIRGYMDFSGIPGHEFVGTVIDGDAGLLGKRVVAEINCVPSERTALNGEEPKHAPDRTVLGIAGRNGAFAERLTVPIENCHVVPDELSDQQAVFCEPLAAACQILRDCSFKPDDRVVVLGSGRLGILCAQVLTTVGCDVVIGGRNAAKLALCRDLGLNTFDTVDATPPASCDVVIECTGSPDGLRLALELVRPRGTIVLKSTYARKPDVDLSPIVINEIRVVGSRCGPFAEALTLLQTGRVRVEELISSVYPLGRGVEAFAAAADSHNIKILLEPGAG